MDTHNPLKDRITDYINYQEKHHAICSINEILQIVSECVKDVLPVTQNASVELHHFEPYTTVIITVPGESELAKQGPYTFQIRTS
mgnify:FL=1